MDSLYAYFILKILRRIERSILGDLTTTIFIRFPPYSSLYYRLSKQIPPVRKPIPIASHQNQNGSIKATIIPAPTAIRVVPARFVP